MLAKLVKLKKASYVFSLLINIFPINLLVIEVFFYRNVITSNMIVLD